MQLACWEAPVTHTHITCILHVGYMYVACMLHLLLSGHHLWQDLNVQTLCAEVGNRRQVAW